MMSLNGITENFDTVEYDESGIGDNFYQFNLNNVAVSAGDGLTLDFRTAGDFSTASAKAQSMSPGYSTWNGILGNQGGVCAIHKSVDVFSTADGINATYLSAIKVKCDVYLPDPTSDSSVLIGSDSVTMGVDGGIIGIILSEDNGTPLTNEPSLMVLMNRNTSGNVSLYVVKVTAYGDPPTLELVGSEENYGWYTDGGTLTVYQAPGRVHIYYPDETYAPAIIDGFEAYIHPSIVKPGWKYLVGLYAENGGSNPIYVNGFQAYSDGEFAPTFPPRQYSNIFQIPSGTSDGGGLSLYGSGYVYDQSTVFEEEASTVLSGGGSNDYALHLNPVPLHSSTEFSVNFKVTLNVNNSANAVGVVAFATVDYDSGLVVYPLELLFSYPSTTVSCVLGVRQNEGATPASLTTLDSKTDISFAAWTTDGDERIGYCNWAISYDSDADEITSTVTLPGSSTWETTQSCPAWYTPGTYTGFVITGPSTIADDLKISFVNSLGTQQASYGPLTTNAPDAPTVSAPTLAPVKFTGTAFSDDDSGDSLAHSEWQITSYTDTTYASVISTIIMNPPTSGNPYALVDLVDGSQYRVRVRYYDIYGNVSAWSSDLTFIAEFSAGVVSVDELPSWPNSIANPSDGSTETVQFQTRITPFELVGVESRYKVHPTEIILWHLRYDVMKRSQYEDLRAFFIGRGGQWGAFYFTDPLDSSRKYRMRFASDSLKREIHSSVLYNVEVDLIQLSEYSQQVS